MVIFLAAVLVLLCAFTGCNTSSGPAATPTPEATATPEPTATSTPTPAEVIPDTGILNSSNNRSPQIFWEASDETFSEIKLSVNQGEYITIGNTIFGKYTVPSDVWESAGAYTLNIKAVDKAGNESEKMTI